MSALVGSGHWWTADNVSALYRWLVDCKELDTTNPDKVQAFLREPWAWSAQFQAMRASDPAIQRARQGWTI